MMMMMMMNLQSAANIQSSAANATASAASLETFYLEDYLDCVESLPEDLQRSISHMRELDSSYQEILRDLESHQSNLQRTEESENGGTRKRILLQIQRCLIRSQEVFDEKLQIAQQILDTIENKSRQLDVDYRNIGLRAVNYSGNREHENLGETQFSKVEIQPERSSKRARRQRNECLGLGGEDHRDAAVYHLHQQPQQQQQQQQLQQQQQQQPHQPQQQLQNNEATKVASDAEDKDRITVAKDRITVASPVVGGVTPAVTSSSAIAMPYQVVAISSSSSSMASTVPPSSSTSSSSTAAVAAAGTKKTKKKKRRSKAEMHVDRHQTSSFSQQHLRGGDSAVGVTGGGGGSGSGNMASSVADDPLIDPDEPTYCLCQQISYGEMIGCDNDRCSIEWFHFSCVGLTTKPKGKWFCPRCRGDRPNVPRSGVRS